MVSELDIYRSAAVLIRERGEDAATVAAQRADELLEAGDMEGCRAWKRVLAAVDELGRGQPRADERQH